MTGNEICSEKTRRHLRSEIRKVKGLKQTRFKKVDIGKDHGNLQIGRVLVTGSTGFVGSNFLRLSKLSLFNEIVLWDKSTMGTILQRENRVRQLMQIRPEIVIHLAWSTTSHQKYEENDANGLWALATIDFALECHKENIRFITLGSAVENTPLVTEGTSRYAQAKNLIRNDFESLGLLKDISYIKPNYIFSIPDERPRLVRDFLNDRDQPENVIKNPERIVRFIHIEDVVSALILTLEKDIRGVIELGGGVEASVSSFVNIVCRNLGIENAFPMAIINVESLAPNEELSNLGWHSSATDDFFLV